ncbi:MAG: peptidase M16 [Candidatus Hydrogenedentota bacterium]
MRRCWIVFTLVAPGWLLSAYASEPIPVSRFTLPNGLEVWHVFRAESQSVGLSLCVRAGSRHEPASQQGISHVLEHLCFEGTERFSQGESEMLDVITSRGGVWNATTQEERTIYWAVLPASQFNIAAEWIAQLVFHPLLPENKLETVRSVVFAEKGGKWDWFDRHGFGMDLDAEVRRALFPDSTLAARTIGQDKTIEALSHADVMAYYTKHYMPNNAVLIVVGNITRDQLSQACESHFAHLEPGTLPDPPGETRLPESPPERSVVRGMTAGRHGSVMIGVRTFGGSSPGRAAFEVLAELLNQRLLKELHFQRGIAYQMGAANEWFSDTGYFAVFAQGKRNKLRQIEAVIQGEIDRVRQGDVKADEFEAAKTALAGKYALSLEGNFGWMRRLESLTFLYAMNEPLPSIAADIESVTPEDLAQIVDTYFTPVRQCVAVHKPLF